MIDTKHEVLITEIPTKIWTSLLNFSSNKKREYRRWRLRKKRIMGIRSRDRSSLEGAIPNFKGGQQARCSFSVSWFS